jgi:hypothetical protein
MKSKTPLHKKKRGFYFSSREPKANSGAGPSELAAAEQCFKAGAGFNERFLFVFGQALEFVLRFQGPAFFSDLFFENQLQWAPAPQILGPFIRPMIGEPGFNISGNTGVQTAAAASYHIQVPVRHRLA